MFVRVGLHVVALGAALLVAAASPPSARAQEPSDGGPAAATERVAPRESVELFQRARDHYQNGRYVEAATDLENALVLDPGSPTLLFNLARVYELSGEHESSIRIYRLYIRVIPESDVAERERAEAAIRRLEGAQEYTRPDEDVYSQPIYVGQRGVADDAFWITLGVGAGITLAGAALAIATALTRDEATLFTIGPDGGVQDRQAKFDAVSGMAIATDVVGAIGAATLLASGLLWVLRERTVELYPEGRGPVVMLGPTLDGAALTVRGVF